MSEEEWKDEFELMCEDELEQEKIWLEEEIESDRMIMGTGDASEFHADRLSKNEAKLGIDLLN